VGRSDDELLHLWRYIAIGTVTLLIAFTVFVDNLGRLFLDPTFHVSEVLFGTLVAVWGGLLGVESYSRIRRNGNGG
jgi:hypothetical protein